MALSIKEGEHIAGGHGKSPHSYAEAEHAVSPKTGRSFSYHRPSCLTRDFAPS